MTAHSTQQVCSPDRDGWASVSPRPPSSGSWIQRTTGEPFLAEILEDPIFRLMMQRDGVTATNLKSLIAKTQNALHSKQNAISY